MRLFRSQLSKNILFYLLNLDIPASKDYYTTYIKHDYGIMASIRKKKLATVATKTDKISKNLLT